MNSSTPMNTKPYPPPSTDSAPAAVKRKRPSAMSSFLDDLHARGRSIPDTPALKRIKVVAVKQHEINYTERERERGGRGLTNTQYKLSHTHSLSPSQPALSTDYHSPATSSSSLRQEFSYTPRNGERMEAVSRNSCNTLSKGVYAFVHTVRGCASV